MSTATTARAVPRLGSVGSTVGWIALAAALSLGAAGLVSELTHPPGGASRAELTYAGDSTLGPRLDDATSRLREIAATVDKMADTAKAALAAVSSVDPAILKTQLDRGAGFALIVASGTKDLRNTLAALPGDGPDAALQYSNATLVRRAAILAALDAATGLSEQWSKVTGRSVDAARLVTLLQDHDTLVASAAALGVQGKWPDAILRLNEAKQKLAAIAELRAELIEGGDTTVLDEWLTRHDRYDDALGTLYNALIKSKGKNTLAVRAAYRDEQVAREQLPADGRSIVVIVAEIARGGLNQAVIAIEDARGHIEQALAEPAPG